MVSAQVCSDVPAASDERESSLGMDYGVADKALSFVGQPERVLNVE